MYYLSLTMAPWSETVSLGHLIKISWYFLNVIML
jgi:hypothetical protein